MKLSLRNVYRVARSLLFSVIVLVAALYLILYILLSVPFVQNELRDIAQREASKFIKGDVRIGTLSLHPFNEVVIHDLDVYTPEKELCLHVETVGAGINILRLIEGDGIEITFGEIIGLDGRIVQEAEHGPLNIAFIIDAFKPKDKNKPPTPFDINLRNVVLRQCGITFDRRWMPHDSLGVKTDFNHLRISDLKADITFPRLSNEDYKIDLRRLSFRMSGGLVVDKLAFRAHVTPQSISVENFILQLPATELRPSDFVVEFDDFSGIAESLKTGEYNLVMLDNRITAADFSWIVPELRRYVMPFDLSVDLHGNLSDIDVSRFALSSRDDVLIEFEGGCRNLDSIKSAAFSLDNLRMRLSDMGMSELVRSVTTISPQLVGYLSNLRYLDVAATGQGNIADGAYEVDCRLTSGCGDLNVTGVANGVSEGKGRFSGEISTGGFDVRRLLGKGKVGMVNATVNLSGMLSGRDVDGEVDVYVPEIELNGGIYGGVSAFLKKSDKDFDFTTSVSNDIAIFSADGTAHVDGEESWMNLRTDIERLYLSEFGFLPKYDGYNLKGSLIADLEGNTEDNVRGEVRLTDISFRKSASEGIDLDHLVLRSDAGENERHLTLMSDWIDGEISGAFRLKDLPPTLVDMASPVLPSLVIPKNHEMDLKPEMEFSFQIKPDNTLPDFLKLPVRLLVPVSVDGDVRGEANTASLAIDIPYLQQGKSKLLRDNRLIANIDGNNRSADVEIATTFPVKKGELTVGINLSGCDDDIFADVDWINTENSNFKGSLSLNAGISRNELSGNSDVSVEIKPSMFSMGSAKWNIDKSALTYSGNEIRADGIKIWHDGQFVGINGVASSLPTDSISVKLASIDLGYVFDTLNINYVTFGGTATGDVTAYGVLSKEPKAFTDNLSVKEFAYNGAVLGDAVIKSEWDNDEKEVAISADVRQDGRRKASIGGGIWVTRDSLSFSIDADRVPVGFLAPFMGAFSSEVKGYASGNAKLYGTFSDIDLAGRILGDSISIKLDYTNTTYHGTDSVYLDPGLIRIPSFRLYDRDGHSAILSGELKHRYFHDPSFTFRITDARQLLCYDTNSKMNPDWYGTIYGDGSASVKGWPGTVSVSVDMDITDRSAFTFVLNDTEAASDYHFLTFTDKRKKELETQQRDSVQDLLASFRKKIENEASDPTRFMMDIRATVSPSALMTLVMDPVVGDKITARGNGAIQIDYESDSDEMQMLGKYTLSEGSYNFSLQDLILRNFSIRPGSSISFNGDPLNAYLDITASYRVNTNLSDLDKSFSTDPELARTNVPVDALLNVKGEMQHPDITFDIDLPTLTQDVGRKVKSIISTDDMMSRQIIYLLALNRFYTPEYMGSSGNGGELAAVASTTLSSQLSNMIGQLTDKFTLAPSFRSDKGDFSDFEMDVALSSRLLNNRLLVNGNFGYRDKSTSNTTFVGDFDIEYLLSRNGNLRLKAYNHFNDQNYYLREALTTQGLGVVYRKDFDNPFTFLRRRRHKKNDVQDKTDGITKENRSDSILDSVKDSED